MYHESIPVLFNAGNYYFQFNNKYHKFWLLFLHSELHKEPSHDSRHNVK